MNKLRNILFATFFLSTFLVGKDSYAQVCEEGNNISHVLCDTLDLNVGQNTNNFWVRNFKKFFVKKRANNPFVEDREDIFVEYEDKRIRRVLIKVLKPFGISIKDTVDRADSWIEKSGNVLHNSTKIGYVKRLLSFSDGDNVSAWELADNERFLRKMSIFNDVSICVIEIDEENVDILVLCEDVFSIAVEMNTDLRNKFDLSVFHKNLFGVGHQLISDVKYNKFNDKKWGYGLTYKIKNISRSYIDLSVGVRNDNEGEVFKASLQKDFVLSSTKWAGLLSFRGVNHTNKLITDDKIENSKLFSYMYTDTWLGYSFNTFNNYKTVKNITITGAYQRTDVYGGPLDPDLFEYYMNRQTYLTGFTLSKRSYYKTNYIYDLGRTEDITEGYKLNFTLGYEHNEDGELLYSGFNVAKSWFFKRKMEYVAAKLSYGSFANRHKIERGLVEFKVQSISKLLAISNYKMRLGSNVSYMIGFNRYQDDYINFNDYIRGLKSKEIRGKQKLGINFTQNIFIPYIVNSFRSSVFLFADVGFIGDNHKLIFKTEDYYGIGLGFKINNDNLIFRTFSFSFAFYPKAPSDYRSFNIIVENATQGDFIDLSPKRPSILEYR